MLGLLLATSATAAWSSACCDRSGCETISGPVANALIDQGFSGAAAASSDVEAEGCAACPLSSGELSIYRLDGRVHVEDEVRDVLRRESPAYRVDIEGRYEQDAETGDYLVCTFADGAARCLQAKVEAHAITTVHLHLASVSPPYLEGFTAAGDAIDERWTLFDVVVGGNG